MKTNQQDENEKPFVSYCLENYGQPLKRPTREDKVRMAEFNDRVNDFTASELRARIQNQLGVDHEAIEDARMQSILDSDPEPHYSLRDEGRNDDGSGESYAERNA